MPSIKEESEVSDIVKDESQIKSPDKLSTSQINEPNNFHVQALTKLLQSEEKKEVNSSQRLSSTMDNTV